MKTIKTLLFIVAFATTQTLYAQSCKTLGTTMQEYNYITTGYYAQVIQQGGDIKKGYDFKDIQTFEADGRKVSYKEFIKDGKDLRAIMAVFTGRNAITSYFCIPLGDCAQEVNQAYLASITTAIDNVGALNYYQYTLAKVLNSYITK